MPATSGPPTDQAPPAPPPATPPKRGRPAQLSRDLIVAAALESNLDTLTVRELAARLGVRHGALYRWVPSHQAIADLVSEVIVERVLPADAPRPRQWRQWLRRLAWSMHDEFLAVPGYASRIARPHQHSPAPFARMREQVTAAFAAAGASAEMAEQSWYIFVTSIVSWLATTENSLDLGEAAPRFDLFLDALLRGLPAREPAEPRP
ncbi:AcrR family transcriptional regulator [Catenulispora sp. EB89]|uniref:TetR/AcrR family transcriptional regulator n=1 Tax=Catenulispora sp. EB89 TaxID=3156257 RepID=UPI003510D560